MKDLEELRSAVRTFAGARGWERFHSPKNLSMALAAEAGELLEPFLWLSEEESRRLSPETSRAVGEELADVLIYLVRLADVLEIDLLKEAESKIAKNEANYPVARSRGNARKYTAWKTDGEAE